MNNLIIESPCYIKVKNNQLQIEIKKDDKIIKQPIDLELVDTILLDSDRSTISVKAINLLAKENVILLTSNERFLPCSYLLSVNGHYSPYKNLNALLGSTKEELDSHWRVIIEGKISNQIKLMIKKGISEDYINRSLNMLDTVESGDITNREGIVAKMFFRQLYGSEFIRHADSAINNALDFGYTVFTSMIARLLFSQGLIPIKGIHHRNSNSFWNLAFDLVEVVRPFVDEWVINNIEDLKPNLTKETRIGLLEVQRNVVQFDGQNRILRSALQDYITSFSIALKNKDSSLIKIPSFKE